MFNKIIERCNAIWWLCRAIKQTKLKRSVVPEEENRKQDGGGNKRNLRNS